MKKQLLWCLLLILPFQLAFADSENSAEKQELKTLVEQIQTLPEQERNTTTNRQKVSDILMRVCMKKPNKKNEDGNITAKKFAKIKKMCSCMSRSDNLTGAIINASGEKGKAVKQAMKKGIRETMIKCMGQLLK